MRSTSKPRPRLVVSAPRAADPEPKNEDAEEAALGCVMLAGIDGSQAEVDALISQLRPSLFWCERRKAILAAATTLRGEGHAVDTVTLLGELKRAGNLEAVGGVQRINKLPDAAPSWRNFPTYVSALKESALRRWSLAQGRRLQAMAAAESLNVEDIRAEFAELTDTADKIGAATSSLIEWVKPSEARAYLADPRSNVLGDGMICRGEVSVIAGWPGLGKSRLATTLAVAGASAGSWMGYRIPRAFRTLIVQSENSMTRIKSEFDSVPGDLDDSIAISKQTGLRFSDARFRREIRRAVEKRRADVLVIDPWSDVTRDENFADHQEALDNIREAVGIGDLAPAVVIVAHLRKQRGGDYWKPKAGRELLHELAGSFALGAKARTVFVLQPATMDPADDRVVFDCGKSNNAKPETASCWRRANGAFLPVPDFDFEEWLNPPDDGGRRQITAEILKNTLEGAIYTRKSLVEYLVSKGYGSSTAYRKTDPVSGEFAGRLYLQGEVLRWRDA